MIPHIRAAHPAPDLPALWDAHVAAEFTTKDANLTVETMVPHASVTNVPTLTGSQGTEALREFYQEAFIHQMPGAGGCHLPSSRL